MKIIGLHKAGESFRLNGINLAAIPADSWRQNELTNRTEIAKVISTMMRTAKPSPIRATAAMIALPESAVFSGSFAMPALPSKDFAKSAPFVIAEKLSINLEEYVVDFETSPSKCRPVANSDAVSTATTAKIKQPADAPKQESKPIDEAQTTVFAVAARKSLIDSILELGQLAKLEIRGIDLKPAAVVRAVVPRNDQSMRLVIDIGVSSTGVAVSEGKAIRLTSSVPLGTNSLGEKELDITQLRSIMAPVFDELVHVSKFFENRICPGFKIEEVILTGGGSNIPGIKEAFTSEATVPVSLATPLGQLNTQHYPLQDSLARTFSVSIGLAMRGADD